MIHGALSAWATCGALAACSWASATHAPPKARCLVRAYPGALCAWHANLVIWCDGTPMLYDDRLPKPTLAERLDRADIEDQLATPYPVGAPRRAPKRGEDPGRVRAAGFFEKMYGSSAREVRDRLEWVTWMPRSGHERVRASGVHRVSDRLRAIARELDGLDNETIRAIASDTSGTFVWRTIKGTDRRSMHAFGAAIDVGVPRSDYWRWSKPTPDGRYPYKNRIPYEIVRAFERHGFIWGGKWYHYDTMHFEYRPEILACAHLP